MRVTTVNSQLSTWEVIAFKHVRGGLIDRGLDNVLKYELTFYGDITCLFRESSPLTLLSSSVIIISVFST